MRVRGVGALVLAMGMVAACSSSASPLPPVSQESSAADDGQVAVVLDLDAAAVLADVQGVMLETVRDLELSPNFVARTYAYVSQAAAVAYRDPGLFSALPDSTELQAVAASFLAGVTLAELVDTPRTKERVAGLRDRHGWSRLDDFPMVVMELNEQFDGLVKMIASDGFDEALQFEEAVVDDARPLRVGGWERTAPRFQPALEPQWGSLRLFAPAANGCLLPGAPRFDTSPGSEFMGEVQDVVDAVAGLDDTGADIALRWEDGAATGTPIGHWAHVFVSLLPESGLSDSEQVLGFKLLAQAMADAVVRAWDIKFRTDVIRPVTVVHEFVDPSWSPFLVTPPFPEYPSAHSAISGAAAGVLTEVFGERAFVDVYPSFYGFEERSYAGFGEAAQEASYSRVLGGIHFPSGAADGLLLGECVAQRAIADFVTS